MKHGNDAQVDRGRQAAIEPYFFLAIVLPQGERGIVKKRKADGFFQFVHDLSGQKHYRNMCLDDCHLSGVMGVALWPSQCSQ